MRARIYNKVQSVFGLSFGLSVSLYPYKLNSVYKKRLVFEIQISHNYSDLIVLKCVELTIRGKNVSY